MKCIICDAGLARNFKTIDKVQYYQCINCKSIYADPKFINSMCIENHYDESYWSSECAAARSRSYGSSLNRVAETFLYSRIPIKKFIDIGSGPGYLLDSLSKLMPNYSDTFYGVELFPPPKKFISTHKNYVVGSLSSTNAKFDAGCCIEVIEHLHPDVLKNLISEMASCSNPGALYYFNSAQPSFVLKTDPGYLDPHIRGHICSYSLEGLNELFSPFGFTVIPLPGRDWGFLAEFGCLDDSSSNFETLMARVWNPEPTNADALQSNGFGPFMYSSGIESARCYYEAHTAAHRTQWALELNRQLSAT